MAPAPLPDNDADRVASLRRMDLLSTPREMDFDRVTRTTQRFFDTEIALISLVERDRQWFKAREGLDAQETPRDVSFCSYAILKDDALVVGDARRDKRFCDNPLVTGPPHIRFYAGQPLTNNEGFRIGTLCVISHRPRRFDDENRQSLRDFGRLAEVVLENRRLSESELALMRSLAEATREKLIDSLTGLWNRRGADELLDREIARASRQASPLTVIMGDIDHFKRINDNFGHPTGDVAIRMAGSLLLEGLRNSDVVGRYGGEEFIMVLPDLPREALGDVTDKILRTVRSRARLVTPQGLYPFTMSLGAAWARPDDANGIDRAALLAAADKALYAAKAGGRDRAVVAEDLIATAPLSG